MQSISGTTRTPTRSRLPRRPKDRTTFPEYAVFTAVEGTLLDFETLDTTAVRPLVLQLHAAGIPVVPVTVMTLDEIAPIATDLGIRGAMIIEAGGAIARWRMGKWDVEPVASAADALLDAISEIERSSGAEITVVSALSEIESAALTGRSGAMLRAMMERRFSEPFLIDRGDVRAVRAAAASLGFTVSRGKRFYYLTHGDGRAFQRLREELRCGTAIAVGGSPLDAFFLSQAEIPVIVPHPDGKADRELMERVPNAIVASAPGGRGWSAAVAHVWSALETAEAAENRLMA